MHVEHQGVRIYYETIGEGRPILFVHGWGGSRKSLEKLAQLLSSKHKLQAIIVDLPGFGDSDNPPPEWGTAEYASCLIALIDQLKIKRTSYFGHSFGGALGIYLSAKTDRISKLILCNSSYKRSGKKSRLVIFKSLLPNIRLLRIFFYKVFFRNSDLARYPHLEPNFRHIVSHDLTPLVSKIAVPTLILWGQNDMVTPPSLAQELHALIHNSELIIIPNARHGLPLRNPELLLEPMSSFLLTSS